MQEGNASPWPWTSHVRRRGCDEVSREVRESRGATYSFGVVMHSLAATVLHFFVLTSSGDLERGRLDDCLPHLVLRHLRCREPFSLASDPPLRPCGTHWWAKHWFPTCWPRGVLQHRKLRVLSCLLGANLRGWLDVLLNFDLHECEKHHRVRC